MLIQKGEVYSETRMHLDGEEEEDWIFEECLLDQHHHVAVALGPGGPAGEREHRQPGLSASLPLRFTVLSFSELVAGAVPLSEEDPAYWESFQKKQEAPKRQTDQS